MIQYKNMKMQVELKSSDKFTQSENKNEQVKKILTTITFLKLSRRFSPHTKSFEVYKINLLCQSGGSQSAGSLIYPDPGPNFCPTRIRIHTLLCGLKYLLGKMGQLEQQMKEMGTNVSQRLRRERFPYNQNTQHGSFIHLPAQALNHQSA